MSHADPIIGPDTIDAIAGARHHDDAARTSPAGSVEGADATEG